MEKNNNDKFKNWKSKATLFLSGQTVSLFGSSLVQYAIVWYITLETKSGIMMTISTMCSFLPQILISLFAGVWADRYNRKYLIMIADSMIALSTLILAIIFLTGYREMWLIFLISAIRSFGAGVQTPAVSAFIPQIVPEEKLMRINGINGTIQSLMMIISPAISGALLSIATIEYIFFIDVVTAVIGVSLMMTLKVAYVKREKTKEETGYIKELKEGIRYSRKSYLIKNLIVLFAVFNFFVVPVAFLSPLMVTRNFGDEVWRLTVMEIAFGAGSIIGGIIISIIGGFKNRVKTIAVSSIMFGLLSMMLGFAGTFVIFCLIMGTSGLSMPAFSSASMVVFQENVDEQYQGRVFSLVQIISAGAMPLGMVLFGPIADIMRVEILLVISGAVLVIIGIIMIANKKLVGYGVKKLDKESTQ